MWFTEEMRKPSKGSPKKSKIPTKPVKSKAQAKPVEEDDEDDDGMTVFLVLFTF
jgi:hypothetical protein